MDKPIPSKVTVIESPDQFSQAINSKARVVIFYGASWCKACHEILGLYHQIAGRYYKRVNMYYLDVEGTDLDFSVIPVVMTYYKGKPLYRMRGANRDTLRDMIKELLALPSK